MDDFGLTHLEKQQQLDLMEIIEDRHARKATIIASQLPVSNWYNIIGEETIADAILDRLVHTSHRIELKGESLRKNLNHFCEGGNITEISSKRKSGVRRPKKAAPEERNFSCRGYSLRLSSSPQIQAVV